MDQNSMAMMQEVVDKYEIGESTVVDIGSYDVNGTYRELFPKGKYIGVDIQPGPNVDVLMDSDEWKELKNIDAVISGQTLEHVTNIPRLMKSIYEALKPDGLLCIIVPSQGPPHDYPTWVGNISEAELQKIMVESGFEILESMVSDEEPWHLVRCVGKKKEGKVFKLAPKEKKRGMNISNVRLGIGVPCTFPFIPADFFYSWVFMKKPDFEFIHADNGPIDTLRNDIVATALERGVTHLIMMDVDMMYHPETIPKLLLERLPIIAALCFRRYPPFDSIMLRITDNDYQSVNDWEEGELIDVDATGAGCIMYNTQVFRDMDRRAQEEINAFTRLRPNDSELVAMPPETREYILGLEERCVHPREPGVYFKFKKNSSGAVVGEDIGFCQDLKTAGYDIFVDTSVPADHLTTMRVNRATNRLYNAMKAGQAQKKAALGVIGNNQQ